MKYISVHHVYYSTSVLITENSTKCDINLRLSCVVFPPTRPPVFGPIQSTTFQLHSNQCWSNVNIIVYGPLFVNSMSWSETTGENHNDEHIDLGAKTTTLFSNFCRCFQNIIDNLIAANIHIALQYQIYHAIHYPHIRGLAG